MTHTMESVRSAQTLRVRAIDPGRLDTIRASGHDEQGNVFSAYPAEGGEPLRCCLERAYAADSIALISWAPFDNPSPWREVGPVFVHADRCVGPSACDRLPDALRVGPRVLRPYFPDGSMNYDRIRVVPGEHDDVEPALTELLDHADVAVVHVRTLVPQCFLFAVERA